MDESIEKKILEESSNDFSILSLFFQADIVVKIVIILLIFSSIWSWAIIFSKYTLLKNILIDTEDFEENFYGSETLSKLSKKLGSQPTHPIEAVFFSAMVYFEKVKSGFSNKNFDYRKSFCENVKKEMLIVINKELSSLEKGLNFLASVGSTAPFIGLFGTVWGIMNSFTAIGISQNTSLAVVAPGIAEALFATALGLVAAIPSVLFFNKFNSMLENISNKLEVFSEEIILIISKEIFR
ncbi:MAG: protein TolQ [Rickettsiales bacterium]|jgi:biopolymer transport protein TolQ|nr:protein TolQ [Rickettsiales bacterium]RPG15038.1 MAG: protein TolQ [Pelagibacteraceae bacterium TMED195]